MFIIKVSFGSESRRVAVERMMPFATLQQLVKNMFAAELHQGFVLRYTDSEGDQCTISSDLELQEAVRQIPEQDVMKMLRLSIAEHSGAAVVSAQTISASAFTDLGISGLPGSSPAEVPVSAVPAAPAQPAPGPKVESISSSSSAPQPENANSAAPAAVASAVVARDINVLEVIEKQLAEAFKAVTAFMTALEIDTKMVEVLDGCHKAFTEVSEQCQKKIITPLSDLTKSKANEFSKDLEKFQEEIKRLRVQLKNEVSKALASFQAAPNQGPAPVKVENPDNLPEEKKSDEPAVPAVYPPVPTANENLPENAALDDLNKLAEMGFVDRVRNLELLAKHSGNVLAVVEELLSA